MEVIVVVGEERKLREFTNKIGGQKGVMMALPSFLALELEGIDLKDLEMGDGYHH